MNHFRRLSFELMEPRLPLASDLESLLGELTSFKRDQTTGEAIMQDLFADQRLQNEEAVRSLNADGKLSPTGEFAIAHESGQAQNAVQIRVEFRDHDNELATDFQAGETYVVKVLIQDMRNLDTMASNAGGVFQAFVDLELSPNIRTISEPVFSNTFDSQRQFGSNDNGSLQGVGAFTSRTVPSGQFEQLLFEVPVVIEASDAPTYARAVPSSSVAEAVLLFNQDTPVPVQSIAVNSSIFSPATSDIPVVQDSLATAVFPPFIATQNPTDRTDPSPTANFAEVVFQVFVSFKSFDHSSWEKQSWVPYELDSDFNKGIDRKSSEADLLELELPGDGSDTKQAIELGDLTGDNEKGDERESEDDESQSPSLFFDERLFLEGAIVDAVLSDLRLHFRILGLRTEAIDESQESKETNQPHEERNDDFVDIANLLRPTNPERFSQDISPVDVVETEAPLTTELAELVELDATIEVPQVDERRNNLANVSIAGKPVATHDE